MKRQFPPYVQDGLLLFLLLTGFSLRYFHSTFIFQGDVPFALYLHGHPELLKANWDPFTLGYLGWFPITGRFFPPNMLMHFILSFVSPTPGLITLILMQINACLSLTFLAISAYLLFRFLDLSRTGSVIGGLIIAMTGFHVQAGLRELDLFYIHSYALVAPALIFMIKANLERSLKWALVAGGIIGASLLAGTNVPMFMFLPLFAFTFLIRGKTNEPLRVSSMLRGGAYFIVSAGTSLAAGAAMLLPSILYTGLTARDEAIQASFSQHIPFSYTGATLLFREWWTPAGFYDHERDVFLGLPILILAITGFFSRQSRRARLWMMCLGIFGFLVMHEAQWPPCLAKPFQDYLSMQSIRYVYRYFFLVAFAVGFFAACGADFLKHWVQHHRHENKFYAKLLGLTLICYAILGIYFLNNAQSAAQKLALVACMFLTVALSLQVLWLVNRRRFNSHHGLAFVLLIFLFLALSRPDYPTRRTGPNPAQRASVGSSVHQLFKKVPQILKPLLESQKDPFRFFEVAIPGEATLRSVWGPTGHTEMAFEPAFDPATPGGLFEILLGIYNPQNLNQINPSSPLLGLYNIRYIGANGYQGSQFLKTPVANVYENPSVFDRYFMTAGARTFPREASLLAALKQASAPDLERSVYLLQEEPHPVPDSLQTEIPLYEIQILKKDLTHIELEVQTAEAGYLVASDLWFPAWKAAVNGMRTPIHRAYYAFRALRVPQGSSKVVFTFDDVYSLLGQIITLMTYAAIILTCSLKRKNHDA